MAELAVTVRSTDPTELNDVTCQWNSRSVIITVERKHEWLYYAVLKFKTRIGHKSVKVCLGNRFSLKC